MAANEMTQVIALMARARAGIEPLIHIACKGGSVQEAVGRPTGDPGEILTPQAIATQLAQLLRFYADEADQIT